MDSDLLMIAKDDQFGRQLQDMNASFKYGSGERIKEGWYFYDLRGEECSSLLTNVGLLVKEIFITTDVRPDRPNEKWVNAIAKKI